MENKEMKSITIESKCDSNDAAGSDLLVFNLLYEFFKNYTPRDKIFTKAKLELEYFDDEPISFITTINPEDLKSEENKENIKPKEKHTSYEKLFNVLNNHEFLIIENPNKCDEYNKVKFSMLLYYLYLQLYGEKINLDYDTIKFINGYLKTFSVYSLDRNGIENLFHTNTRLLCEKINNIFISAGIPFVFYPEDNKNIKLIMNNMIFINMVLSAINIRKSTLYNLYDEKLIQNLIGSVINSIYIEKDGFNEKSIGTVLSSSHNSQTTKDLNKFYKLLGSSMYMVNKKHTDYFNNHAKIGKQLPISTFYDETKICCVIKDYFDYVFFNNKRLKLDIKDSRYIPVLISINTLAVLDNIVFDSVNKINEILCSHGINANVNNITGSMIEIERRI